MRAAVLHRYGTPRYGEFGEPLASDEQVVVAVSAAAVNQFDVLLSSGTFVVKPDLPYVVGSDGVGRLPDGRRVYFESTASGLTRTASTSDSDVAAMGSLRMRTAARIAADPDGVPVRSAKYDELLKAMEPVPS
jgi:NADPH:quinone reductase-like Zn-dependent oxidoreductase